MENEIDITQKVAQNKSSGWKKLLHCCCYCYDDYNNNNKTAAIITMKKMTAVCVYIQVNKQMLHGD